MIVVLGATGYIGQAFSKLLRQRDTAFQALSRRELDYTQFEILLDYLRHTRPDFVINAAGYTGKPNVDACEEAKADTLMGNTLYPQVLAHACMVTNTPWGHVSSGCIYSGAKITRGGETVIERDMTRDGLMDFAARNREAIHGFAETDTPNFSFRRPPCSFYSGTKALAEEAITTVGQGYLWRLRIPFDKYDSPRNYLSKVQRYSKVYDNVNSISHREDFVRACIELWEGRAPFGIYNITNPGFVTTREVVQMIQKILKPARKFEFWGSDEEFYRVAAKTPRSNCVLDTAKLESAGIKLPAVHEALERSLREWQPEQEPVIA